MYRKPQGVVSPPRGSYVPAARPKFKYKRKITVAGVAIACFFVLWWWIIYYMVSSSPAEIVFGSINTVGRQKTRTLKVLQGTLQKEPPKTLVSKSLPLNTKGIDPTMIHLYTSSTLKCLGEDARPVTLLVHQINDDFCDCPGDSFDEPGTNACIGGVFTCQDGSKVFSSMVADGICDCTGCEDEGKG